MPNERQHCAVLHQVIDHTLVRPEQLRIGGDFQLVVAGENAANSLTLDVSVGASCRPLSPSSILAASVMAYT